MPCPQIQGARPSPSLQTREHLAKAQRGLPGEGVSEVIQTLVEVSQDGTSYSGDLLSTIDVLRNMTEIFRRAYYSPTPGDVQVSSQGLGRGCLGKWMGVLLGPSCTLGPDLAVGWARPQPQIRPHPWPHAEP